MKRGALETLGTAGVDRSDGEEKRAKADAASTAAATPHHRAGNRSLAGDEQENLDPAAPIRDGSERIGEGGDAIALLYVDEPVKEEVLDLVRSHGVIQSAKPLVFDVA